MSLIKKAAELTIPTTIYMMVYGQAGMGKTTFALSAPNPLLIDFDGGVGRVNMNHLDGVDIVQVQSWQDVQDVFREDLSPYETIVIDTVGKMMDFIIIHKCGMRQPSIRDWGGINQEFSTFCRNVRNLGKNVIFVAHRDTRKEGDDLMYIPALREKNYNSIVTELDLLGYMETRNVQGRVTRTITFDPTNRNDGKNTCGLPGIMQIPALFDARGNVTAPNDFVAAQVMRPYRAMLAVKKDAAARYNALVQEISEGVEQITDAAGANHFIDHIGDYEHIGSSLAKARAMFAAKVKALGLVYNKEAKRYEDAA